MLSGRFVIYLVIVCLGLCEKCSCRWSKKRYIIGVVYSVRSWFIISLSIMVIFRGCCSFELSLFDNISGSVLNSVVRVVIIIG